MLEQLTTRPGPRLEEAAVYIRDTLTVLARLADDIMMPDLATRLRAAFQEPVRQEPWNWNGEYSHGRSRPTRGLL